MAVAHTILNKSSAPNFSSARTHTARFKISQNREKCLQVHQGPVQDNVLAQQASMALQGVTISFPFHRRLQTTGNEYEDSKHRLKARDRLSLGCFGARKAFPEKEQSRTRQATGRAVTFRTPTMFTLPLILYGVLGRRYEGTFESGLPEGHGVITWVSGDVWEGDFKQGLAHGQGTLRSSLPFEYRGGYANGQFEGHGSCRCSIEFLRRST